ncbi:MAG: 30S ribosomal protein S7 [Candidatus Marinimicrobia bacterium]|nr:30S ribosomal protein S7 [Candidatus Neomarinimicrobiota bacterium]MBL7046717.1 30S ribosomal protein S7 [Candidatus Neomarinimicrobiota bacterium]
MRRSRAERRQISPDPVYGDVMVQKFINNLLQQGKKGTSERIFYGALNIIEGKTKSDPLELFHKAMENVKPLIEVKSRRIGGATYQIPVEVANHRAFALGTRWIITYAKNRKGKPMAEKLASELLAAANNDGGAIKKKEDTHRMAEANKAFAHFGR